MWSTSLFASSGNVDILVSQEGMPLANYTLKVDNKELKTDEIGFVTTEVDVGEHKLTLIDQEKLKEIKFKVVKEERTQLIVNLLNEQVIHDLLEPESKVQGDLLGQQKEMGTINIVVKSINGEPISNVRIFIKGIGTSQRTNSKGFAKLKVPLGEVTLSLSHQKFSTQILRKVKVEKNNELTKVVSLTPTGLVLEDFVVLAPSVKGSIEALIEVRRKSSSVADVMSAEQMAKTGDSDAAGSLRRVTGLTLKDGKYVYVRGLGERYSATLLNGVALPSPDPSRRVIPLDLFPVQFLDSMIIQKSYSPDMPGEFGGGSVMLKTKSMPDKFFIKASLSQTHNSNVISTKSYQGGSTDWYGVDDGGRKLPESVAQGGDADVLLDNSNNHALVDEGASTLPEFSLSVGDSWKLKPLKIGYTFSGIFKDGLGYTEEERFRYRQENGEFVQEDNYLRQKSTKEKVLGGIFGLTTELYKDHSLTFNYIGLRNSTDYVAILEGENAEGNTVRVTDREFAARVLKTALVQGESQFKDFNNTKLNIHYAKSNARRDEPSRISDKYSPNKEGVFVYNIEDNTAYQRRYYDLQEEVQDIGFSVATDLPWFYKRKGEFSVGLSQLNKDRVSSMKRFGLDSTGDPCGADLAGSLDQIFSECKSSLKVANVTQPTDNYTATQKLQAYHFKTTVPLLSSISLSAGMRYESSVQRVNTISPFEKDPILSELSTYDWLPGSSLTWKMNKKMQVRLAQSETISRPDLRELSDTLWQDFETGYDISGNPDLKATVISSYDARWEWYFAKRENLSFGFFYKDFENPIEQEFQSGSDPRIMFLNAEGAKIYGAEIEFSKRLSFVSKWLRNFTLSGNYAYILSEVSLGDLKNSETVEKDRPLQGQSNYTANVLLDYEHKIYKFNASLAYNVYGKRIAFAAPEGLPSIWELPFHQLDFVFSKRISKNLKVGGKIRNLINPKSAFRQGDKISQGLRKGQSYTLGLSMEI